MNPEIITDVLNQLINERDALRRQNKRYREALEKLVNAPQDMSRGCYADYADRVAREALEDDPDV